MRWQCNFGLVWQRWKRQTLIELNCTCSVYSCRPTQHAGRRKPGWGPLYWTHRKCTYLAHKFTTCWYSAAFLRNHGYERKNVAVVSVKRHQLQGDFVPLTSWPGASPGPIRGTAPDPHCASPLRFQKYFSHYPLSKLSIRGLQVNSTGVRKYKQWTLKSCAPSDY